MMVAYDTNAKFPFSRLGVSRLDSQKRAIRGMLAL